MNPAEIAAMNTELTTLRTKVRELSQRLIAAETKNQEDARENTALHAKIEKLTDQVIALKDAKTDAEDTRRELDTMRAEWAGVPTAEEAITRLRERMREWFPKYEVGAIQVAMPAATAMRLLATLDEWRLQVDNLLATLAEHAAHHPTPGSTPDDLTARPW